MKLSTFTDYSLRLLMFLATRPGERATIAQVATAFGVSEHHLVKVAHSLGKAGWLANVRGKGGGLELAVPPEAIVIGEVVRHTEGRAVMAECFADGNECNITPQCRLRGVLAESVAALYGVLDRHTIADVVRNRRQLETVLFDARPATRSRA
jgi:Rrf2 family transcriptional regulator, nitric oxide-sensitive transcriptional repressor